MMVENKNLLSFVYLSTILHVMIVVTMILFSKFELFSGGNVLGSGQSIKISQIQSSVRIDVVAMPKETLLELKALENNLKKSEGLFKEETPPQKIEVPKDTINKDDVVFEKEKKSNDFMSMLKDMSKKELELKQDKKLAKIKNKKDDSSLSVGKNLDGEIKNLVLKGNQLSKGNSFTGGGDAGEMSALSNYASGLPDLIRPYWKLPSYLKDQDYKCRIRIFLRPSGSLIKAYIYESSGNEEYDNKALSALKKAEPFHEVPVDIQSRASQGDIILGFPL